MTTKIEAHERNVGDIFSDLYRFEIPPYQRPYAWEEEQARELLDDLLDAMDNQDVYKRQALCRISQAMQKVTCLPLNAASRPVVTH